MSAARILSKHILYFAILFAMPAFAQQGPSQLNISGGLFNSSGQPITSSNVRFKIDIYDKAATCLMYTEQHTGVDLSASRGAFSLIIGAGTSAVNNLEGTTAFDSKIFENPGSVAPFTGCGSGLTLNPGDTRLIRVSYDIGSGLVAMTPDIPITSSAYAMVAETLQGKAASDFIMTNVNTSLSQANVDYIFSNTNYPNLKALVDGISTQYIVSNPSAAVGFNGQRLINVGTPTGGTDATNKTYVDSNLGGKTVDVTGVGPGIGGGRTIVWDQTQNKWVTSSTGSVGLVAAGTGLNGGNITASGTLSVDVGTTANKILQLDASARIPAVDGSLLTNVNAMFLQGRSISIAAPAAQQVLGWNSTTSQWEPETPSGGTVTGLTGDVSGSGTGVISTTIQPNAVTSAKINNTGVAINRLLITDATTGATVGYATCAVGEVMQWTATGWACKSVALMLGTSGVTSGTYGNATQVSQVGVDAQGRVVSLTNVNIAFPVTSVAGRTGAVTLTATDVSGLGTAATQNVGTGVNNVLQFTTAGQLPALDGSLLTNLNVNSSQWITTGQNIYYNLGNVGIGTTSPRNLFDVQSGGTSELTVSSGGATSPKFYSPDIQGFTYYGGAYTSTSSTSATPGGGMVQAWNTAAVDGAPAGALAVGARNANVNMQVGFVSAVSTPGAGSYTPSIVIGQSTGATAYAERMRIDPSGNVGIGTTSPGYKLDVAGTVNATSLMINGVAVGTSSSPWQVSGNTTYYNLGNVGIGTSTPSALLHVASPTPLAYGTPVAIFNDGGADRYIFRADGGSSAEIDIASANAVIQSYGMTMNHFGGFNIKTGGRITLTSDSNSNIGIGTMTPVAQLEVESTSTASSGIAYGMKIGQAVNQTGTAGFSTLLVEADITGTASAPTDLAEFKSGSSVKANIDQYGGFSFAGFGSVYGGVQIAQGSAVGYTIGGVTPPTNGLVVNGNVGIGTATPGYKLDVAGTVNATALMINGVAVGTSSSPWQESGTNIYYNAGDVGIGTASPTFPLSVGDGSAIDGAIVAKGYGAIGTGGTTLTESGAGKRLVWYPKKAAFRAGSVSGTQWDDANIGNDSIALGASTLASGTWSAILGSSDNATGQGSIALGSNSTSGALSSTTLGNYLGATGQYSTSIGAFATVSGNHSLAIGLGAPASTSPTVSGVNSFGIFMGDQSNVNISANNTMAILGGNVGIGTGTPNYQLDVAGTVNATALMINGVAVGTSSSPWQMSGANTYYNAGNVGVGTTSPGAALDVNGAIYIKGLNGLRYPASDSTPGASIAIGPNALSSEDALASTAFANTAIGYKTLSSASLSTSSTQNTAVGYQALKNNTAGSITAVGANALAANTTGAANTAVGWSALAANATGTWNVAVGTQALTLSTGSGNVAMGHRALFNTTAGSNTSVGSFSGLSDTTGTGNTFIGNGSGYDVTTGSDNIVLGYFTTTGTGVTTGSNNILMGYDVRPPSQTASNQLNIGNLIYATGLASGAAASSGNVGIGTTTPNYRLDVAGTVNASALMINGVAVGTSSSPWQLNGADTYYNAGGVGIGTASPAASLDVYNNGGTSKAINAYNGTNSGYAVYGAAGNTNGYGVAGFATASGGTGVYGQSNAGSAGFFISGAAGNTSPTLVTHQVASGTADLFQAQDSSGASLVNITSAGSVGIGTTTPAGKLNVHGDGSSANFAVVSIGGGPFDGSTAGKFAGNVNGTEIGVNAVTGYTGSLLDLQVNGASKMSVDYAGGVYASNFVGNGLVPTGNNPTLNINWQSYSAANKFATAMSSGTFSMTSGTNGALKITPTYNQTSGTAANTDLLINRTETAVGSGAQYLIDTQVGGTSKFNVSDVGSGYFAGQVGIGTTTPNYTLDVNGTINASSILINGTAIGSGTYLPLAGGTMTGPIVAAAGSNTAPAYSWTGDTNTGFYHLSAGAVAFSSAGTGNAQLDANGLGVWPWGSAAVPTVRIGTTSSGLYMPASGTLAITTNGTERLRVNGSGNVGIGTTTPNAMLDIGNSGTQLGTLRLEGNTSGFVQLQAKAAAGSWTMTLPGTAGSNGQALTTNGSGVMGWTTVATSGGSNTFADGTDAAPSINFVGETNTGFSKQYAGQIDVSIVGIDSWGFNNQYMGSSASTGGVLSRTSTAGSPSYVFGNDLNSGMFQPATSQVAFSTASTERMRIDQNGNVGIGTSSPTNTLSTIGNVDAYKFYSSSGSPQSPSTPGFSFMTDMNSGMYTVGWGVLAFSTASTERIRIDSSGNVGIGTGTPMVALDVNGAARLAKNSAQPFACDAGHDGAIALTHVYTLCICNGGSTSWVQSKDGSTACAW